MSVILFANPSFFGAPFPLLFFFFRKERGLWLSLYMVFFCRSRPVHVPFSTPSTFVVPAYLNNPDQEVFPSLAFGILHVPVQRNHVFIPPPFSSPYRSHPPFLDPGIETTPLSPKAFFR